MWAVGLRSVRSQGFYFISVYQSSGSSVNSEYQVWSYLRLIHNLMAIQSLKEKITMAEQERELKAAS